MWAIIVVIVSKLAFHKYKMRHTQKDVLRYLNILVELFIYTIKYYQIKVSLSDFAD